jgi:hypothetical protein
MPPREETTRQTVAAVKVRELLPGPPAMIVAGKVSKGLRGNRPIVLKVPVPDQDLWERLCASVRVGDRIDLTVETRWTWSGYTAAAVGFTPASGADEPV